MRLALLPVLATACGFHGAPLAGDDVAPDADPVPSCHGAACHRLRIAIHHERVAAPLQDFPVLLHVVAADLAHATGPDLVFTDGAAVLPYERVAFAGTELVAWVHVPALSPTADTVLYLYYGDPAASDGQDPTHVWDSHFEGVWHLDGAITDATAHANTGTTIGGPVLGVPGAIGTAVRFAGDDDGLIVPASAGLARAATAGTISLWVSWTKSAGSVNQRLLMSTNTFDGDSTGFEWAINSLGYYYFYPADAGANNYAGLPDPFTDNAWHLAALTLDLATKTVGMYLDGQPLAPDMNGPATLWTHAATSGDWLWGGGPTRRRFTGMLDELRVSSVVRSAGWLATEWANQHDVDGFASVVP